MHVGCALGGLVQERLVEDRTQASMLVRSPAHCSNLRRALALTSTNAVTYTACGSLQRLSFTMSHKAAARMTTLIAELRQGNTVAREELVTLVYPELRRIAAHYMRQERPGHTLRTTGLVNEMYVRLFGAAHVDWQSRAHFFAAVAREMRHILVDYARARNAKKRGDGGPVVSLTDADVVADQRPEDVLALDEALSRLESIDPRASRVVELRYFTGLSEREAAEALGVSLSTLKRDWTFARAWLLDQLGS
jgi:RNA polymerase sigma factor (TIGR02999 family)